MKPGDRVTVTPHTLHECIRDNKTADFHTKSWSYRFNCPVCGKHRRYNTNFLGNRNVLGCDGVQIKRFRRDRFVTPVTDVQKREA